MNTSLFGLSDEALVRRVRDLAARERETTIELILHIAEVDRRKLYRRLGYEYTAHWCMHELGMSESAAYKRVKAGCAASRYPAVLKALLEARLHLSGLAELVPHLNAENVGSLVAAASKKSRREIERMLAERFPGPRSKTTFTTVAVVPVAKGVDCSPAGSGNGQEALVNDPYKAPISAPEPSNSLEIPLSPGTVTEADSAATEDDTDYEERVRFVTEFSGATRERLRYAAALLSHVIRDGDMERVLDRVLDLAIAELHKDRFALTDRPRAAKASEDPAYISAETKRLVWEKYRGRCALCGRMHFLQFDHIIPIAKGGSSDPSNVRLLCAACNRAEADRELGALFMAERIAKRRELVVREAAGPYAPRCRTSYFNHVSGSIAAEPLRTSKCRIGPFSDSSSPTAPITAPGSTSWPLFTLTALRWP
jgi:hypothetical protein